MASLTRWTRLWVNSGSCWWTGRPGVLLFMGSQRVGHNWVTELTQSNLQIQCNLYQTTNDIFHRARTKNFIICMETPKTLNSQRNLEKEEWSWKNQLAWFQTILQSYSHQDSMVLAQKEKYRSMEQDRKPRDKPMHLWIPNGEKIVPSISGARKTGQPHVKEWN